LGSVGAAVPGLFVDPEREAVGSTERGEELLLLWCSLELCRVYADEGDRGLRPVEEGRSVSCRLEGGVLGG
jgi:hypothetical protein